MAAAMTPLWQLPWQPHGSFHDLYLAAVRYWLQNCNQSGGTLFQKLWRTLCWPMGLLSSFGWAGSTYGQPMAAAIIHSLQQWTIGYDYWNSTNQEVHWINKSQEYYVEEWVCALILLGFGCALLLFFNISVNSDALTRGYSISIWSGLAKTR